MWKPLSVISGLLLLGAGGLMYTTVRPQYKAELLQRDQAKANQAKATKNQSESKTARTKSDADLTESKRSTPSHHWI